MVPSTFGYETPRRGGGHVDGKTSPQDSLLSQELRDMRSPMSPHSPESLANSPQSVADKPGKVSPRSLAPSGPSPKAVGTSPKTAAFFTKLLATDNPKKSVTPIEASVDESIVIKGNFKISDAGDASVAASIFKALESEGKTKASCKSGDIVLDHCVSTNQETQVTDTALYMGHGLFFDTKIKSNVVNLPLNKLQHTGVSKLEKETTSDGTVAVIVNKDEARWKMKIPKITKDGIGEEKYHPGNSYTDPLAYQVELAREYTIIAGERLTQGAGPYNQGYIFGQGSYGKVFKAKHDFTGECVAVKVMYKEHIETHYSPFDYEGVSRHQDFIDKLWIKDRKGKDRPLALPWSLFREVAILKLVHCHPNFVKFKDVWEDEKSISIIMEHVNGGDFYAYLIHRGRFPEAEAIGYFRQILSGLQFLHTFHICHRDLKMENLLIDYHGKVMIADFGLSVRSNGPKISELAGSLEYCPPEVFSISTQSYDGTKADIWALGVILICLMAGWLPFPGEEYEDLKKVICGLSYHIPDEFSDLVKDLIWHIFQPDPAFRITIDEIWKHPVVAKYPHKDKHGMEVDRFQMPLTMVDLLGPLVEDTSELNMDILEELAFLWQRTPTQITAYLMTDRPNHLKRAYLLLAKQREWTLRYHDAGPKLKAKRRAQKYKASRIKTKVITRRYQNASSKKGSVKPLRAASVVSICSSIMGSEDEAMEVDWEDDEDDLPDVRENRGNFIARVNAQGSIAFAPNVGRNVPRHIPRPPVTHLRGSSTKTTETSDSDEETFSDAETEATEMDEENIFYRPFIRGAKDTRPDGRLVPYEKHYPPVGLTGWIPLKQRTEPKVESKPEPKLVLVDAVTRVELESMIEPKPVSHFEVPNQVELDQELGHEIQHVTQESKTETEPVSYVDSATPIQFEEEFRQDIQHAFQQESHRELQPESQPESELEPELEAVPQPKKELESQAEEELEPEFTSIVPASVQRVPEFGANYKTIKRRKSILKKLNDFKQKFSSKESLEDAINKSEASGKRVIQKLKGAIGLKEHTNNEKEGFSIGALACLVGASCASMALTPLQMPQVGKKAQTEKAPIKQTKNQEIQTEVQSLPVKKSSIDPRVYRKGKKAPGGMLHHFLANKDNVRMLTSEINAFSIRKKILKVWKNWGSQGFQIVTIDHHPNTGFMRGRVVGDNKHRLKKMTVCCQVRVRMGTPRVGTCVIRFTREAGSRRTFAYLVEELARVLDERRIELEEADNVKYLSKKYF